MEKAVGIRLSLFFALLLVVHAAIPVIIDTDIGSAMDDTWALGYLLASPELDIKLIVTATQNTTQRAQIVAKFLTVVNRTDIPIAIGFTDSEYIGPQYEYAADFSLASYEGIILENGITAMIDMIESLPAVTILELAPSTNLAEVILREPDLVRERVRPVTMAGSIYKGYNNSNTPVAEWNVAFNVTASNIFFSFIFDRMNLVAAPLDTSGIILLYGQNYASLVAARDTNPLINAILENYYYASGKQGPTASTILYDVVAAQLLFSAHYLEFQTLPISITDTGYTIVDYENGTPILLAMQWDGLKNFENDVTQTLLQWSPT